jgi:hypothetical protein
LYSVFVFLLDLDDPPPRLEGEEPAKRKIIKAVDGRKDGQPVQEAKVTTQDENNLVTV